jgi:hypothetical protein
MLVWAGDALSLEAALFVSHIEAHSEQVPFPQICKFVRQTISARLDKIYYELKTGFADERLTTA